MKPLVIVKLGGSVLTDKSRSNSLKLPVLNRLAKELAFAWRKKRFRLIIVHGGGSFGHSVAKRFGVQDGRGGPKGWAVTHTAMQQFNLAVVLALQKAGLPAVEFQPSAVAIQSSRRIAGFYHELLEKFLVAGLVPVCYGDAVADGSQTVSILSGDQLVSFLARKFRAEKVVLVTDVEGVFDGDPRKPSSKLITSLRSGSKVTAPVRGTDVTGGMKAKVEELISLAADGTPSIILNGLKNGRLQKALLGGKTPATAIGQTI